MKFKKGDIVTRNNNRPNMSFESIKNKKILEIKKVKKLSNVYFYGVTRTYSFDDDILFPQINFDDLYDLDIAFCRRRKIDKILKKT